MVEERPETLVEEWLQAAGLPVLRVDGTKPPRRVPPGWRDRYRAEITEKESCRKRAAFFFGGWLDAAKLPVLRADGTRPPAESAAWLAGQMER